MLHRVLTHFFGYGTNTDHEANITLKYKNTHYKRGDIVSGTLDISPLYDFQLSKEPISLSLKRKSLGQDERLRDFFQDNHIKLPKQTWTYPRVFNKGMPVFLDFSLETKRYFTHSMLQSYIIHMWKDNHISRDQRSLQEKIESLETFSWHLQCVISNTIKIFPLALDDSSLQETITWLKYEKGKMVS